MTDLPKYDELPALESGGRSGWGVFGADDSVGLLNLQTPERIARAARLIKRGALFPLDVPIDAFDPPIVRKRGAVEHVVIHEEGSQTYDDYLNNFYLQGTSQWDSLAHFGYEPGSYYNGATEQQVESGVRNTIDNWARRGIAGRAVVLDLQRALQKAGRDYDPGSGLTFGVEDLELARELGGVQFQPGDIVLLHTGFISWYLHQPHERRVAEPREIYAVGLEQSDDILRYFWEAKVAGLAADNTAVECSKRPSGGPFQKLHRYLIGQLGFALGELWWLADLAADCARDGVYEVFLASSPLHVRGGIGSPANALAIK